MTHDWCLHMDWCRRCGRPLYEIIERNSLEECDGLPGVLHARYRAARDEMWKLIGPIIEAVYSPDNTGSNDVPTIPR